MTRSPKDSIEREWYRMYQGEKRTTLDGHAAVIAVQGAAAFQWADTLAMLETGLAPLTEILHLAKRVITLTYSGNRVTRVDQWTDSVARSSTVEFPTPVYAFNQLDLLLRAVPLNVGQAMILPLYSEITAELEHDTLQVLSGPHPGAAGYTLRFADPAIVSTVVIDPQSREFLSYETLWRSQPGSMRRISADPPVR